MLLIGGGLSATRQSWRGMGFWIRGGRCGISTDGAGSNRGASVENALKPMSTTSCMIYTYICVFKNPLGWIFKEYLGGSENDSVVVQQKGRSGCDSENSVRGINRNTATSLFGKASGVAEMLRQRRRAATGLHGRVPAICVWRLAGCQSIADRIEFASGCCMANSNKR